MSTQYSININDAGHGAVTIVEDSRVEIFTHEDTNFPHILAAAKKGLSLDDALAYRIPRNITRLSERVSLDGDGFLFFDDKEVEGEIAETVKRFHAEGRDLTAMIRFMENLADNTSARSREQLFLWLTTQNLEIDQEGFVLGYRGLTSDMMSQHAGGAYVLTKDERERGVTEPTWVDGHVPNHIGNIVSMDREMVDDDPHKDCSNGLHIGSENYARNWADLATTVVVRFNPADVVAVPYNGAEKVRVCKYEVLSMIDNGEDHEAAVDPDKAVIPTVEGTNKVLDEVIPIEFRKKMSLTDRWKARARRRKED